MRRSRISSTWMESEATLHCISIRYGIRIGQRIFIIAPPRSGLVQRRYDSTMAMVRRCDGTMAMIRRRWYDAAMIYSSIVIASSYMYHIALSTFLCTCAVWRKSRQDYFVNFSSSVISIINQTSCMLLFINKCIYLSL